MSTPETVPQRMKTAALLNRPWEMIELLDGGADIEARDDQGMTALDTAARYGSCTTAEVLLRRGADPNTANENGWTPLHHAADDMNHPMIRMLLNAGADPRATNSAGHTPRDLIRVAYGRCLDELRRRPAQRATNNAPRMSP